MNEIDIIKRHISKPIPLEVKSEDGKVDTINLKPLNIAQQTHLMLISKKFSKIGLDESKDIMEQIQKADENDIKEAFTEIYDFFVGLIKRSVNGIEDSLAEDFVDSNFDALFGCMEKMVQKTVSQEKTDLIKKKIEERKAHAGKV